MECLGFTFKLSGLSFQEVTHIIRHRAGSFAAQCTGDRDLRDDPAVIPEAVQNSPEYLERYKRIVEESKQLYADKTDSLKNFFGIRSIDKIPVDIDKGDNSDEKTLDILRGIIIELEAVGIGCGSFQPYFSGSGYHLMLSGELFNFKAIQDLQYVVKQPLY